MPPKKAAPVTVEELKQRYSPERTQQFLLGHLSGKEYNQVSPAQMLKMAVMGFTQYEQGRYPEAQAIFEALVFLDPTEPYYRIALGAAFLVQDELDLALTSLTAAITLKTVEVAAFVNRGEVHLRLGKIAEAAKDFKRAVELDPQVKDPLTQRARMLAAATLQMIQKARAAEKSGSAPGAAPPKPSTPAKAPTKTPPPAMKKK